MIGFYGLGTVWWVTVAALAAPHHWPHVLAIWAMAILPQYAVLLLLWSSTGDDAAALSLFIYVPWAFVTLLICVTGASHLRFNRKAWLQRNS